MSKDLFDQKRNFQRLIVKTNAGSLTPERTLTLKEKIFDPNYLDYTIDRLAESLSAAFAEGYLADPTD